MEDDGTIAEPARADGSAGIARRLAHDDTRMQAYLASTPSRDTDRFRDSIDAMDKSLRITQIFCANVHAAAHLIMMVDPSTMRRAAAKCIPRPAVTGRYVVSHALFTVKRGEPPHAFKGRNHVDVDSGGLGNHASVDDVVADRVNRFAPTVARMPSTLNSRTFRLELPQLTTRMWMWNTSPDTFSISSSGQFKVILVSNSNGPVKASAIVRL